MAQIFHRIFNPLWPILEAILPYGRRLRSDVEVLHRISKGMVHQAIDRIEQEHLGEKDMVEEERAVLIRVVLQSKMTEEDIANNLLSYILAGR